MSSVRRARWRSRERADGLAGCRVELWRVYEWFLHISWAAKTEKCLCVNGFYGVSNRLAERSESRIAL